MLATLLLAVAVSPSHLVGDGGLIGPPQPVLAVSAQGQEKPLPVHGWFSWEYGMGVEELLGDERRRELVELRNRHVMLSSASAACAVLGSVITSIGLFTTPNFVNVSNPDPGGLVVPIVIASLGAAVGLAAIPLAYFIPGDVEIETLVESHNNDTAPEQKLSLSREAVPGGTFTLVRDLP